MIQSLRALSIAAAVAICAAPFTGTAQEDRGFQRILQPGEAQQTHPDTIFGRSSIAYRLRAQIGPAMTLELPAPKSGSASEVVWQDATPPAIRPGNTSREFVSNLASRQTNSTLPKGNRK